MSELMTTIMGEVEDAPEAAERLRSAFKRAQAISEKVKPFVKPIRPATTSTAGTWQRETLDKPASKAKH